MYKTLNTNPFFVKLRSAYKGSQLTLLYTIRQIFHVVLNIKERTFHEFEKMELRSRQPRDHSVCEDSDKTEKSTNKFNYAVTDPFISVNERPVDDISLDFFYKPHTVTLLAVSIIAVMYFAFVR